jgi:hypothetical protein
MDSELSEGERELLLAAAKLMERLADVG